MSIHRIIMNPFWFTEILSSLFHRQYFQRRNCLPFENTWIHSSPVFDEVRFTHLFACSWLVHQCYLCLVISPAPSFRWGSGFHHQCCLCPLGSPPIFFCSIFFVVHFVSIFTFLVPCGRVSFDFLMKTMCGSSLSSTAGQTYLLIFDGLCMFAYNGVQRVLNICVLCFFLSCVWCA